MPTEKSTGAIEQLPCDFLMFLSARLGLDEPAAKEVLGDWLVRYEPGALARGHRRLVLSKSRPAMPAAKPLERHAA